MKPSTIVLAIVAMAALAALNYHASAKPAASTVVAPSPSRYLASPRGPVVVLTKGHKGGGKSKSKKAAIFA